MIKFDFTKEATDKIKELGLPVRKTVGSAGYDFVSPEGFTLQPDETIHLKTCIKAYMPPGVVLKLYIRSSMGIKRGLALANGTGIIDSDYADNPDNEGNIILAVTNRSRYPQTVRQGEAIVQGIFVPYLLTDDDTANGERKGGIGSTNEAPIPESLDLNNNLDEIRASIYETGIRVIGKIEKHDEAEQVRFVVTYLTATTKFITNADDLHDVAELMHILEEVIDLAENEDKMDKDEAVEKAKLLVASLDTVLGRHGVSLDQMPGLTEALANA